MKSISQKSCDCASKITKSKNDENFSFELGICIMQASKEFREEVLRDYKVDLEKKPDGNDKLWESVGFLMAFDCPEVFSEETKETSTTAGNAPTIRNTVKIKGTVTYIDKEGFVNFSVKTEQGKTLKFYWLGDIESNIDITQKYHTLNGSKVSITYFTQEIFDARINEYHLFNIIQSLQVD